MLSTDKWPVPKDADEARVVRNVKTHGCHVTTVAFDLDYGTPDYVHSVGFYARFDQPDVIVMGVSAQTGANAINELSRRFAGGQTIQSGDVVKGLFEGRDGLVSAADVTDASAYIDWLLWFYTPIRRSSDRSSKQSTQVGIDSAFLSAEAVMKQSLPIGFVGFDVLWSGTKGPHVFPRSTVTAI